MTDPYKVLGISPDVSDDEVKKAYRALARKYHPDKYRDSDLADLASEKMKEINAAYEEIQNIRKNGGNQQQQQTAGGYGYNSRSSSSNPRFAQIRALINAGDIPTAERTLLDFHEGDRTAEWNFLYGYVLVKKGQFVDAQRYFDIACSMDPYNQEYRAARAQLRRQSNNYGNGYNKTTSSRISCCSLCTGLWCADCCCRCMTNDRLGCC